MSKRRERYMTVLGGYVLDMENHGHLVRKPMPVANGRDDGADPLGNGMFKMHPSGDVVNYEERTKRLAWLHES